MFNIEENPHWLTDSGEMSRLIAEKYGLLYECAICSKVIDWRRLEACGRKGWKVTKCWECSERIKREKQEKRASKPHAMVIFKYGIKQQIDTPNSPF